jgi:hypothetical protein
MAPGAGGIPWQAVSEVSAAAIVVTRDVFG